MGNNTLVSDDKKTSLADPVPIKAMHHIEFWVGNAKQAANFYRQAFGFSQVAYSGLETGVRDKASYLLEQGEMRLVLSSPLISDHPIAQHIIKHGDGVRDLAFHVDDTDACYREAISRGARSVKEPHDLTDENGTVRCASIHTYGETIHSFISNSNYRGTFLPGYREKKIEGRSTGIRYFDHVVGNVEYGKMNDWVDFYENVLGFTQLMHFSDDDISTKYSALMSKVMQNGDGRIKFPINEPAEGLKKSQIEEYLDFYEGAGVQHIALLTDDIIHTVKTLRENGVEFLEVPKTYYDFLEDRVGKIDESMKKIRELGILVDRDDEGYLLQLFTQPVQDRPTVFFEIIQRKGSRGFGQGNFQALFEAIELAQEQRGNL